jgi:SecD/SecF fusion protein
MPRNLPRNLPRNTPRSASRTRPLLLRVGLVLILLGAASVAALTTAPRWGLDLRGGTQIVLEARDGPTVRAEAAAADRALEVLRRRVDALGVAEPTLTRSGERRIIVELPGLQDPTQATEVIGRTAQLTIHPVLAPSAAPETGQSALPDESGQPVRLGAAALTGEGVTDAEATLDQYGTRWMVDLNFSAPAGRTWAELTGRAACAPPGDPARRVAIVLDGKVLSSPQVEPSVACGVGIAGGATQITGSFTRESAQDLAALVKGGSLPVPVEIVEQRTVGPSLGADAIRATWQAGAIGVAATLLFLVVVYRLVGLLAALGLGIYALLSYAALVTLGATFTLPGLAGFVLAIGMAVDANVLAFERAREEYAARAAVGRRLLRSATEGFRGALTAVLDSNVSTLLAAGLLFWLASGPVRGFGVTLSIGVLASMVSALVVVRLLVELALAGGWVNRHPAISGVAEQGRLRAWLVRRDPQLLRRPRRWLCLSAGLVVLALVGVGVRGLDLGIEFTGGRLVQYAATQPIDVTAARQAVNDAGFPRAVVQAADRNGVAVRVGKLDNAEKARITQTVGQIAPGLTTQRDELIGPTLGSELRTKAVIALGLALAAQLGYLAVRFRWTYATAAVTAMVHDVAILIGAFAWLGKPVDGVFLAAVLTVIGYSINDTVVLFDRVRALRAVDRRTDWRTTVGRAVVVTAPRTINTGLGAFFVLAALAVLGGDSLHDFALALIIGLLVGTWSSGFTASPLLVELQRRAGDGDRPRNDRDGRRRRDERGDRSGSVDPYGRPDARPDASGAVV